jgi:hypothetical protein
VRRMWFRPSLLAFVCLTWLFGGIPGLVVGSGLAALALVGSPARVHWIIGLGAIGLATLSVAFQALSSPSATPTFAATHAAAHLLVGIGIASISVAILRESLGRPSTQVAERHSPPEDHE